MVYLLSTNQPIIKILHYQPGEFPNPDKSLRILVEYDYIDYSVVTNKHSESPDEQNSHLRL